MSSALLPAVADCYRIMCDPPFSGPHGDSRGTSGWPQVTPSPPSLGELCGCYIYILYILTLLILAGAMPSTPTGSGLKRLAEKHFPGVVWRFFFSLCNQQKTRWVAIWKRAALVLSLSDRWRHAGATRATLR